LGWLMPDIHRNMKPGDAMTWHISIGIVMLMLTCCGLRGA
jgi:cytochrome b561